MAKLQPPHCNGVMEFSEEETELIRAKLLAIQESYEPSDEQPVCDTFYLVSQYNKLNVGAEINGDTAEMVLMPAMEEVVEGV